MSNLGIDLGNVLAQAAQVTQEQQEKDSSSNMKLVYPQNGELKVRLLYNQPAGVVMRKFERHKINGNQITCLSNYGRECPVCKILDNIQNVKGTDLWQLKRTTRGIAYAEFIEANYKWDNPQDAPTKGEIVLLMFPWTVYTDLNRLINSAGQNIYDLIASNIGGVFKISRWVEKGQTKYRAEIDPFDRQHQTCPTDEEYQKLIMELPSLNEKFVPIEITDAIIKSAQNTADELNAEYLSPNVYHPNMGQAGSNLGGYAPSAPAAPPANPNTYTDPKTGVVYDLINNQWIPRPAAPATPPVPPSTPSGPAVPPPPGMGGYGSAPAAPMTPPAPPSSAAPAGASTGNPPCFGKHGTAEVNPNQCLMCPSEATCKMSSGGR